MSSEKRRRRTGNRIRWSNYGWLVLGGWQRPTNMGGGCVLRLGLGILIEAVVLEISRTTKIRGVLQNVGVRINILLVLVVLIAGFNVYPDVNVFWTSRITPNIRQIQSPAMFSVDNEYAGCGGTWP